MNIVKQYRNARKLIKQIESGEWKPERLHGNPTVYVAKRGDKELWLASGPFFLRIGKTYNTTLPNYLGIWRIWVWYKAARKLVKTDLPKPVYDEENW